MVLPSAARLGPFATKMGLPSLVTWWYRNTIVFVHCDCPECINAWYF
jgi:hypothetical protein